MSKVLTNDLKMLYEEAKNKYCNFTDDYFVVSDAFPIDDTAMYFRRNLIKEATGLKI